MSENWTKLTAFAGFDPLHDIDEVMLTSAADRENAPALLVLRGRFNLEKLGAGAEQYHGVAISSSKDKAAGVVRSARCDDGAGRRCARWSKRRSTGAGSRWSTIAHW